MLTVTAFAFRPLRVRQTPRLLNGPQLNTVLGVMARFPVIIVLAFLAIFVHANPEYARENNIQGIWTYNGKDQLPEDCTELDTLSPEVVFERLGRPTSTTDMSLLGGVYGLQIEATHLVTDDQNQLFEYYTCADSE